MDNPRKKKADAKRVSQQPHEQAYQKRKTSKSKSAESDKSGRSGDSRSSGRRDRRQPE